MLSFPRDLKRFSQKFFLFKIDQENNRLIAKTREGKFFLALLHLWSMNFKSARKLLRENASYLRP